MVEPGTVQMGTEVYSKSNCVGYVGYCDDFWLDDNELVLMLR